MPRLRTVGSLVRLFVVIGIILLVWYLTSLAGITLNIPGAPPELMAAIVMGGMFALIIVPFAMKGRVLEKVPRVECPHCKSTRIKPYSWKEVSGTMERLWICDRCKSEFIP